MVNSTYQCYWCKQEFVKDRLDEEAQAEYEEDYGPFYEDEVEVVCEDCYNNLVRTWRGIKVS